MSLENSKVSSGKDSGTHLKYGPPEFAIAFFILTTLILNEGELLNIVSKLILVTVFLFGFLAGQKLVFSPFVVSAGLFFGISVLSYNWSVAPESSSARIVTFLYQIVCYLALSNLITWNPKRIEFSFSWVVIAAMISGTYVILVNGITFQDQRYVEGFISSGQLAYSSAFAIIICVYRYARTRRNGYLLCVLPLALFLLLTSGRRGLLLVVLFVILFSMFASKGSIRKILALIVGTGAVIGVYLFSLTNAFVYDYLGRRLESLVIFLTKQGTGDSSVQGRQGLIDFGLDLFNSSPLVGNGIDTFSSLFAYRPGSWDTSADNNYIQLMADLGVLGLLAYYVPMVIFVVFGLVRVSEKSMRTRFALAVVVSMCVLDFSSVWFFSKVGMLMMLLAYESVRLDRGFGTANPEDPFVEIMKPIR